MRNVPNSYNDQNFGTFETHFLIGETSGNRQIVSVLIVGLSYGARNVLSYTNFPAVRESLTVIGARMSHRKWRENMQQLI